MDKGQLSTQANRLRRQKSDMERVFENACAGCQRLADVMHKFKADPMYGDDFQIGVGNQVFSHF